MNTTTSTTPSQPSLQTCTVSIPLSLINENLLKQILSGIGRQPPVLEQAQLQGTEYSKNM